ncbi:Phosphomannomutase [Triticum urartu]|uniref:Phosphomannomutase n=1 Tax=Triticum urartu TaxID=4572 RepID=M8A1M8_TRIUA|nr:Phosphomannomutase [Triticum urartu]
MAFRPGARPLGDAEGKGKGLGDGASELHDYNDSGGEREEAPSPPHGHTAAASAAPLQASPGGRRDRGGVRRIWIGDAKLTFSAPRILLHLLPATPAVLYHAVVARRCAPSLLRSSFSGRRKMVASVANAGVLALFDVDGTLTAPRKEVTLEMLEFMKRLREVDFEGWAQG